MSLYDSVVAFLHRDVSCSPSPSEKPKLKKIAGVGEGVGVRAWVWAFMSDFVFIIHLPTWVELISDYNSPSHRALPLLSPHHHHHSPTLQTATPYLPDHQCVCVCVCVSVPSPFHPQIHHFALKTNEFSQKLTDFYWIHVKPIFLIHVTSFCLQNQRFVHNN